MSVRLFVGNLSFDVTESELRDLFSEVGAVTQVRIPLDRESGRPRGFAFIDLEEGGQADEAIRRLHQHMFKGRALVVNEATAREERSRRPPEGPGGAAPPPFRGGEEPPPPDRSRRNYGPDAQKTNRKAERRATKAPKGPIREFGGGFSDLDDGLEPDEKPFWEMAESADSEDGDA